MNSSWFRTKRWQTFFCKPQLRFDFDIPVRLMPTANTRAGPRLGCISVGWQGCFWFVKFERRYVISLTQKWWGITTLASTYVHRTQNTYIIYTYKIFSFADTYVCKFYIGIGWDIDMRCTCPSHWSLFSSGPFFLPQYLKTELKKYLHVHICLQ